MDNALEWLLSELLDLSGLSGQTGFEKALDNLYNLPLPPLDSEFFRGWFGQMFGVGMVVSLLTTLLAMIQYLNDNVTDEPWAIRFLHAAREYIVMFYFVPMVYLGLYAGDFATKRAFDFGSSGSGDINEFARLISFFNVPDAVLGFFLSILSFFVGWGMAYIVLWFTWGVAPLTAFAPIPYATINAGKGGQKFWTWTLSWILGGLAARPTVAWVLAFANRTFEFIHNQLQLDSLSEGMAILFLLVAMYLPFKLRSIFAERIEVNKSVVSGRVTADIGGEKPSERRARNLAAESILVTRAASEKHSDVGAGGRGLRISSTALTSMANKMPTPTTKIVAVGAGMTLGQAARRRES